MTARERNLVREAIDRAMRAQLEAAGGFKAVEQDARHQDHRLAGRRHGNHDRRPLIANELRNRGWSLNKIGQHLKVHHTTVLHWLDEERQVRHLEQQRERRYRQAIARAAQISSQTETGVTSGR